MAGPLCFSGVDSIQEGIKLLDKFALFIKGGHCHNLTRHGPVVAFSCRFQAERVTGKIIGLVDGVGQVTLEVASGVVPLPVKGVCGDLGQALQNGLLQAEHGEAHGLALAGQALKGLGCFCLGAPGFVLIAVTLIESHDDGLCQMCIHFFHGVTSGPLPGCGVVRQGLAPCQGYKWSAQWPRLLLR